MLHHCLIDLVGATWWGPYRFHRFSETAPYPPPPPPGSTPALEPGAARPRLSASRQHVAHVARVPAASARSSDASVVESVSDGLQRRGACLLHLLDDRQHVAREAIGLRLSGLTTAAANGIEVRVAQLHTARLGSCQRRLSTLRDQRALLLCQGRVDV